MRWSAAALLPLSNAAEPRSARCQSGGRATALHRATKQRLPSGASPGQKRDIFYNNAARFLRLTDEEMARHHGRAIP